jgi:hypothetical protein
MSKVDLTCMRAHQLQHLARSLKIKREAQSVDNLFKIKFG